MKILLTVRNLNDRPYIHGTSTVRALLEYLWEVMPNLKTFNIRLTGKLKGHPVLLLGDKLEPYQKEVANGSFTNGAVETTFMLVDSYIPVREKNLVDEQAMLDRMEEEDGKFVIGGLSSSDDPLVAWTQIEKTVNTCVFKARGFEGQAWFTGLRIDDVPLLMSGECTSVASSIDFELLSARCARRKIYYNDVLIGSRTAVFA